MDIIADLNAEYGYTERFKSVLPIGLFGSFIRITFLESLKNHLINNEGFNAKVSYDLRLKYPQYHDEIPSAYDFRLSEKLLEESRIHIIFFFKEEKGEEGINNSATMELGMLYAFHQGRDQIGRYSLILCESGYDNKNIGGMRKGIRPHTDREWRWHDFDTYEECQMHSTQFCYDCILDYYLRMIYPSRY